MPKMLTCPRGHHWQLIPRDREASTDLDRNCPVCGAPALSPSSDGEERLSETVEQVSGDEDASPSITPLNAALRTGPYLTPPSVLASEKTPENTAAPPRREKPNIAGYEILGELGRGGMGVVYKARQLKLQRLVALKMILSGVHAAPQHLERFRTEAEAVARLQHPHIVQIHEIGEQDGLPYFSLEFVDGGSLAEKLAGTPLPARSAAELMRTLARAMDAAHRYDIIHRDLKPANILLTRDGTPKITDFGLAKKLDADEGQTRSGAIMGTPCYMAPEQAEGNTRAVGPSADIYALGSILYEALIGRPPFKSATLLDTLEQVRTQEPVPPRRLLGKLPRDLDTICLKCLEKDPRKRYETAGALADDLERWLAGEPILARPTPSWERAWKWAKRRPALSALSALLLGVLVSAFALVSWQWQRAETERDKAEHFAASESQAKREVEAQKETAIAARRKADAQRRDAQRLATRLLLERGVGLCEQGKYGPGLLWLARGLETAPEEAGDLQSSLRSLLGGWSAPLCRLRRTLEHPPRVSAAALSADGKRIVTGGWDKMARLWDAATGKPLGQPMPHPSVVRAAAFGPKGNLLLTVSTDETVRFWNAETGAAQGQLPRHPSRVHAAAFHPNGEWIATACRDKNARVWDRTTGRLVAALMPHTHEVLAVTFSPDGKRLATGSRDKTARLWETESGKPLGAALKHSSEVLAVALDADGKTVLTGCRDGTVRLWEGQTGQALGNPLKHEAAVWCVAFRAGGRTLLTAGDDRTCCLWDRATGRRLGEPIRHQGALTSASFRADGEMILTGGMDGVARLWETLGSRIEYEWRWHPGRIHSLRFSLDGRSAVTASMDNTARVWDADTGKPRGPSLPHPEIVLDALFTPDGQTVLTRSSSVVRLWNAADGKRLAEWPHDGAANDAAFSPDGQYILTASADRTARLWRTKTGQLAGQPLRHPDIVTTGAFHPNGKLFVTACRDGFARLWQTESLEPRHPPLAHGQPLLAAAFSPNGELLLTRSRNTVRLWEVETGQPIGQPVRHAGILYFAAFSPDSACVVAGGSDRVVRAVNARTGQPLYAPLAHSETIFAVAFPPKGHIFATRGRYAVRLWNRSSGEPIGESLRHAAPLQTVDFTPDGKILFSASLDGTVRLWDAATSQPLGEPFAHPEALSAAAIRPDGRGFLVAGANGVVRSWPFPTPLRGTASTIEQWLQANTGLALDRSGAIVALDGAAWRRSWQATQKLLPP